MMDTVLSFESLYELSIRHWPASIDTSKLLPGGEGRYAIAGLGVITNGIEARYLGHPLEVLLREMHMAIYELLHKLARDLTEVRPSAIRGTAVKAIFDKRLRDALQTPELGWNHVDVRLVEEYLSPPAFVAADAG
ncbi:hypothetical protein ACLB1G_04225 [Oxalobacteraceae bacterium A2-2]